MNDRTRDRVQGEGDYDAARRFNKAQREFVDKKLRKQRRATGAADDMDTPKDENQDIEREGDRDLQAGNQSADEVDTPLDDDAPTQVRRGGFKGTKTSGFPDK